MTEAQEKVLAYLNKERFGFLYTTWISERIGIDYEETGKALQGLVAEDLVDVIHTEPDPCWHISKAGIKFMKEKE